LSDASAGCVCVATPGWQRAGCGASLVSASYADRLLHQRLVSLDDNQSAQLAILRTTCNARRAELGRYEVSLRRLAAQVRAGLTAAELHAAAEQAEEYWRNIFEQAAPGYTALAATLSDDQVRELLGSLHEADEKWREYSEHGRLARGNAKSMRERGAHDGQAAATAVALIHEYAINARRSSEWHENQRIWHDNLPDAGLHPWRAQSMGAHAGADRTARPIVDAVMPTG
jgi:hypothetical protein